MPNVADLTAFLESFAPVSLAEDWDNVGLLLGDRSVEVRHVMTCLTLTPDVAEEAIERKAELIVSHHPILFRGAKRITSETSEGRMLLALVKAGVAVHSPHTAFDSTIEGVNDCLCRRLALENVRPIRPLVSSTSDSASSDERLLGAGRCGTVASPCSFSELVEQIQTAFDLESLDGVPTDRPVGKVAVACGAAAEFLDDAILTGCDVLITGEARFHAALEARSRGVGLILMGHYASERFAVEELAGFIASQFPELTVWASRVERDPLVRFPA